jgi:hypothetical protein
MTALEKAWYIMYEKAPAAHAAGADLSGSQLWLSRSFDCVGRTCICAGSALDAGIRVDLILAITLMDRFNRAFCSTGSASDAFIGNLVCHN